MKPHCLLLAAALAGAAAAAAPLPIDRRALVDRHQPVLRAFDTGSPLSVGNGEFAFTAGNGGLLAAVAMMAAGWDGAPERPAPGFPADGSWTVRAEGLRRMP